MKQIGLAVLLLFTVGVGSSQAQMSFGGGAGVGLSAWMTSYEFTIDPEKKAVSVFGTGPIFGGHAALNVNKYLTARLNIDYSMYSSDKEALKDVVHRVLVRANPNVNVERSKVNVDGENASVFSVTANAIGKYPLGAISPYVILGIGIHAGSFTEPKTSYETQQFTDIDAQMKLEGKTAFCFNAGVGVEYKLKFMKVFFELYYGAASGVGYLPIMVGASFP
jgi:opacity protein-like surface antigen